MNAKVKLNIYSFVTVFFWAAAFPVTKMISDTFSPHSLGLIRCIVAASVLVAIGKFLHIRRPFCRKDVLLLAAAGVCGFALYLLFFNTGIRTITSATSSVIVASTPIMTAVVCSRLYRERISRIGWVAIFLAFLGVVVLLFQNGVFSVNIGILWTLGAAVVFCIYNVLNRRLSSAGYTPVEIVSYAMLCAAAVLMIFLPDAVAEFSRAELSDMIIAVSLGIFPSAASYVLWAKAIELSETTNEVTNYMFITPLLSTVLGFILLHEIPDAGTAIGGIIIIIGVVLFGLKGK